MKSVILILMILTVNGCSDKKSVKAAPAVREEVPADYDTIAIDSFSAGAVSAAVEAKIRQRAVRYNDSLARLQKKEENPKNNDSEDVSDQSLQNKTASEKKKTISKAPHTSQQNP